MSNQPEVISHPALDKLKAFNEPAFEGFCLFVAGRWLISNLSDLNNALIQLQANVSSAEHFADLSPANSQFLTDQLNAAAKKYSKLTSSSHRSGIQH